MYEHQIELDGQVWNVTYTKDAQPPSELTVSGRLFYHSQGMPAIAGATIRFSAGEAAYECATDADGNYTITLPPGDYVTSLTMPDAYIGRGKMAVNTTDAAILAGWSVNPYPIPMVQFLSGDVSEYYGHLSSNDAGVIQYYFLYEQWPAGLTPPEYVHSWASLSIDTNGNVDVNAPHQLSLSHNEEGLDIAVRASGDFNGSGVNI